MSELNLELDLTIDFASNANNYRRLHGGGNGQPIAKACGLKTYRLPLTIIDATAGLGQDAFVLASLGCKVIMLERNPEISQQLTVALKQGADNFEIKDIIANMQLISGDATKLLPQASKLYKPDIIYLDPMFPDTSNTALARKPLRIIKQLVGEDLDADLLLPIALKLAKRRIVVKRPRHAGFLNNTKPHSSQLGKANRFDIYMPTINR